MWASIKRTYSRLKRATSRTEWMIWLLGLDRWPADPPASTADPAKRPYGLILIQIDGLGRAQLDKALAAGEMPNLHRLLHREHYICHAVYSGLPSSTPAVQGELFYGVKGIVPAFGFRGAKDGRVNRMYDPVSAQRIQKKLEQAGTSLLDGGSAYCNIYTGGAAESYFCAASMGWADIVNGVKKRNWLAVFILNTPTILRSLPLMVVELVLAIIDVVRGVFAGRAFFPELQFLLARVAVGVLMRDMITVSASMDIARGLPVIHLNFVGYDEQSHRRGPGSAYAHWALKGIDRSIGKLWRAQKRQQWRGYDLWVYSDHGQERTQPYLQLTGYTVQQAVNYAVSKASQEQQSIACEGREPDNSESESNTSESSASESNASESSASVSKTSGRAKAKVRFWSAAQQQRLIDEERDADENSPLVVAVGPVGHVYPGPDSDASLLSQVAALLVSEYQVPAAIVRSGDDHHRGLIAYTKAARLRLPQQGHLLIGPSHPYLSAITDDLIHLCYHQDAGDIVLLGCIHGVPPVSFPVENGAHAGIGPNETAAFALLPPNTSLEYGGESDIRPLTLHRTALRLLRSLHASASGAPRSGPSKAGRVSGSASSKEN